MNKKYSIMPLPAEMKLGDEQLVIDDHFCIGLSGYLEPRLERAAVRFIERLAHLTGIPLRRNFAIKDSCTLLIDVEEQGNVVQQSTEDESYNLDVNKNTAVLSSKTLYGTLRGIETFVQLVRLQDHDFVVPEVRIIDYPRFPWRGLLIDSVRHWIPPEVIKRNIEAMATVKLNVLHWHLTNDQGFRIECNQYPKLHKLGSDGLFYRQKDVKEIVQFAADRGIRVLPEFDMPGHTSSWFVGYPDLASAPGPYQIERNWGGHQATMDPTREETYKFISNFLSEMATLFPDPYVHVGGDEVSGNHWQNNSDIRKFMVNKGIRDTHHLQAYFNRRLHGILHELNKELVGWDPILHAELPKSSVIQSVRGQSWLAGAVQKGFRCIAGSEYYLDQLLPASFHYESDPFDAEVKDLTTDQQKLIIGGEASMWTEFANAENIDGRVWPRAAVIAERLWSARKEKDVKDMYRRLRIMSERLNWTDLTHESGPSEMLDHLVDHGSVERLKILAETLVPTFDIRWKNHNYTAQTPLNRLVDSIVPESETARLFSYNVDLFIADPSDIELHHLLLSQLQVWQSNHLGLEQDIERSTVLTEIVPLSVMMGQVAGIGIMLATALIKGEAISKNDWEKGEILLKKAREPIAELVIAIVSDIQKLSKAVLMKH